MTRLKHTFKDDALFKMIFVQNPDLLKRLVSELLAIRYESIEEFKITNPEMPSDFVGKKFCQLDIIMVVDGRRVDLEIQVRDEGDYPQRVLFNWARVYSSALPEGGDYIDLPQTVIISIINFKQFRCKDFHSEFAPLEVTRHELLTDKLRLHFYELPKLPATVSADDGLRLWLTLFKAKTKEELAKIKALGVPVMTKAIEAYESVSVSPEFLEIERLRSKARHNEAAALRHARQEAQHKTSLVIAKNLLRKNLSIDDIVDSTGLTRVEVENLRSS